MTEPQRGRWSFLNGKGVTCELEVVFALNVPPHVLVEIAFIEPKVPSSYIRYIGCFIVSEMVKLTTQVLEMVQPEVWGA